jgi:MraZ protein
MDQFIGSHHNKIDAKGRVSVPASFRSVLKKFSKAGEDATVTPLVLRPSHQYPCIEGWTEAAFAALSAPLEDYEQYSEEHEDLSVGLFGDACVLETDKEGRVVLPAEMLAYAGVGETVVFIGASKNFQIWEPAAGARRITEARERIKSLSLRRKAAA